MKRAVAIGLVALAGAGGLLKAQPQRSAEVQLKAAQQKADVEGDLKGAIEAYKKVIADAKGNRAIEATALVQMAECYQKLGNAEARSIYERLIREFADQKEVYSIARARLGDTPGAGRSKGDRPVWTGPADGFGTISPDGRFLTYTDWGHGARLVVRDLETGTDRPLTDQAEGSTQFSVISKNGKEVVYEWFARGANPVPAELRVINLQSATGTSPRRLSFDHDVRSVAPYDWSADGQLLAVEILRNDRTNQIGLVAVRDGSLRVLKSTEWKSPTKIFFSRDGRYVAYDLPVSETSNDRHLYVTAVDGSRDTEVVAHASHNVVMAWSADDSRLLFASDRGGPTGLWSLPVADGKPAGAPSLLQADIGSTWSLGTAADGTLFAWKDRRGLSVRTASIDLARGTLIPNAGTSEQFIRSRGRPEWSPDGKSIVYQSCNGLGGGPCEVHIWSVATGNVRELPTPVKYQQGFRWSPDGRFLITAGLDFRGRRAIYRIDAQTGDAEPMVTSGLTQTEWAPDGGSFYYRGRGGPGMLVILERDLTTGTELEVFKAAGNAGFRVSPDGRSVAYSANDGNARTVRIGAFGSTATREVLRAEDPEEIYPMSWTPDGRALLALKGRDGKAVELWLTPVDGTPPNKIDGDISNWDYEGGVRLSPDGKQVTFVHNAAEPGYGIWAFENYLRVLKSTR